MCFCCKKDDQIVKYHFELEYTVFKIFMSFSVAAMAISAVYTMVDLMYNKQL